MHVYVFVYEFLLIVLSGGEILPEYSLRKTSVKCLFSEILLFNLNLDHVRLYEVDLLCFPANRGRYSSSAG